MTKKTSTLAVSGKPKSELPKSGMQNTIPSTKIAKNQYPVQTGECGSGRPTVPAVQRRNTTSVNTTLMKSRSSSSVKGGKENISLDDTPLRMATKANRSLRRKAVLRAASTFIDEHTLAKTPSTPRKNATSIRSFSSSAGLNASTTRQGRNPTTTSILSKSAEPKARSLSDARSQSKWEASRINSPGVKSKGSACFVDRLRSTSPTPISWSSSVTLPMLLSPGAESEDESMQMTPLTVASSTIDIQCFDTKATQHVTPPPPPDVIAQEIRCDDIFDISDLKKNTASNRISIIKETILDSETEDHVMGDHGDDNIASNMSKDIEVDSPDDDITEPPPPPPPTPSNFPRLPKFDTFSLSSALFGEFPQLDQQAVRTRYELATLREGAGAVLQRARQFGQTLWSPSAVRAERSSAEARKGPELSPTMVASLRRSPVGIGLGRGTLRHSSSIRKMVASGKLWTSTNIETV